MSFHSYVKRASAPELLTAEEEQALAKDGSPESCDKLIKHNLRLVIYLAKAYRSSEPLEDLVSEGNVGLTVAAHKFKPNVGRFATYARWWINREITNYLNNNTSVVRVPGQARLKIRKYDEMKMLNFSDDEIKKELGVKDRAISNYASASLGSDLGPEDLKGFPDTSINQNFKESFIAALKKTVQDHTNIRERDILYSNLGLFGTEKQSLEVIAQRHEITGERARQIRDLVIRRLRSILVLEEQLTPNILKDLF